MSAYAAILTGSLPHNTLYLNRNNCPKVSLPLFHSSHNSAFCFLHLSVFLGDCSITVHIDLPHFLCGYMTANCKCALS